MRQALGRLLIVWMWTLTMVPSQADEQKDVGREAVAVFAGGCFWCLEADFDKLDGVTSAVSGYTGGRSDNPTYKNHGRTGHYEAVRITYDPETLTYQQVLDYFWRHVDPTDATGQFCDRGDSYRTAIFVAFPEERIIAETSVAALNASGILPGPVVTPVLELGNFWPAEEYHQKYYKKNPLRYNYYRRSCGRDKKIRKVWKNDTQTARSY